MDPTLRVRLSKYITSDLLEQLPEIEAVSLATQRLNSLHKALASFLPGYINKRDDLASDYGSLTPGVFMFADVSGFTSLSEKLMNQVGTEGIEILTQVFNEFFSTMLEILAKSEGELLKFAGDALLTFFPLSQPGDPAAKAINTGLRMQRAIQEKFQPIQYAELREWFGEDHGLELSMSIGISQGDLFEALVGNIAQRDHMVMGRLPGMAMAAEEVGERDDVIVDEALYQRYQDHFDMVELAPGFYQVIDNFGDQLGDYEFSMPRRRRSKSSFLFSFGTADLLEDLEKELTRVEMTARFVSNDIVNKMVVKGDHIESENRLTTVIFVHFTGFAELLDAWGDDHAYEMAVLLSRFYSIMHQIIDRFGGVLTRSDPYKLGSKLLITFGAPVAHPDDPDRAVATVVEMMNRLQVFNNSLCEQLPLFADLHPIIKLRAGITQGDAYAGEVGWKQRREYTVMGDQVNLAARLMSHAEFGDILVSKRIHDRVQNRFEIEALDAFQAKGKAFPVYAYRVLGAKQGVQPTISDAPFVGHDVSLLTLNESLETLKKSGGVRVYGLAGEPGVGRSRLARQVFLDAISQGYQAAWATCRAQSGRKDTIKLLMMQLMGIQDLPDDEATTALIALLDELDLQDLKRNFTDLFFAHASTSSRSRRSRNTSSKVREDLFDKLSGSTTLALKKDEMSQFRKRMMNALQDDRPSTTSILWNPLGMKTSLSEALAQFLEAYSQQVPLLLVMDDAHKENKRAFQVVRGMVDQLRELPTARVMLLITYDPAQFDSVNKRVLDEQIVVGDLPEDETYLLAAMTLGVNELGDRLSQFLWGSSRGRAFYIESLLQTLTENDQIDISDGIAELKPHAEIEALPDDVRGLIISRIDRLPSDARTILRSAAVLGDRFTPEQLQFVSNSEDALEFETHFGELVAMDLLGPQEDGFFTFRHGVTQQAVYEELTRLQRQKMHMRVADYYSRQDEDIEVNVSTKVYHLMRCGMPILAMSVASKAAQAAENSLNLERALEYYLIVADIVPSDQDVQAAIERIRHQLSS